MRRTSLSAAAVVGAALLSAVCFAAPRVARADGCYICQGGGYVQYIGPATFEMRKKAQAVGCTVTGTASSCSNPKGTVIDPREIDNRRGSKRD